MTSIFANLFLFLQAKLNAITVDGNKAFRIIDHDLGQLEFETPPLTYPAILIDFGEAIFTDMGENCKVGEAAITLKVVFTPYSGTSNIVPDNYKQKGLNYYELEGVVKKELDGWCPDETTDIYSPLDFVNAVTDKSRTDLRIRVMTFAIGIDDYSNKPERTFTPVTPNIGVELE